MEEGRHLIGPRRFLMEKMNQNQGIAIPIDAIFFLALPGNGKT